MSETMLGSTAAFVRSLIPAVWRPPAGLGQRLLTGSGYYRFRTAIAARGQIIEQPELYQPLFCPWNGDPQFERVFKEIAPHTLVSRDRLWVLWCTLRQALTIPGDIVECGVFRGGTARMEAMVIKESGSIDRKLHLFDSFEGMPPTVAGVDQFRAGDFADTSAARVADLMKDVAFAQLHVGFIPNTFQNFEPNGVAWVHVDVDIYEAVRDCIAFFFDRLAPGGFMIFDDYGFPSCPGARRAVDEGFKNKPAIPLCLPTGQCLVFKTK